MMTLRDLYYANSGWHFDTVLSVTIRLADNKWHIMTDSIACLPKMF